MKHILLLVSALMAAVGLSAQTDEPIVNRIINQVQLYPQEKTYTHTDAADYAPGDRIWLKVYVVNALSHEPISQSLYAYVELIAPDETLVTRAKLISRDGIYAGYLDIPKTAGGGRYLVRSYTELSRGVEGYENFVPVYVGGSNPIKNTKATDRALPFLTGRGEGPLHVEQKDSLIRITTTLTTDSMTLLAHCRAYPFAIVPISKRKPVVFHRDSIPQGIISLLLLNRHQMIVAERSLYSDNGRERCRLDIVPDKESYATNEEMVLTLNALNLHEGEKADISVSVTSPRLLQRHRPSSIVPQLMLASDLPNGVDSPERIVEHASSVDSILARQPWRRYDFARILREDYDVARTQAETSQTIRGHVESTVLGRPLRDAYVSIISPQAGIGTFVQTDALGRFEFPELDFVDGVEYMVRATSSKGNEDVRLVVDGQMRPEFHMPIGYNWEDEDLPIIQPDTIPGLDAGTILLEDIEVTGELRNTATEGNTRAMLADYSIGLRKIEEMGVSSIVELIRRIPGIRYYSNNFFLRAASSIYNTTPIAVAIDGVINEGIFDLNSLPIQDVARVDVYKTGNTVIWGSAGGNGVVNITLKDGTYNHFINPTPNQMKIKALGFQKQASFLSYSGWRKTLYWNPSVTDSHVSLSASEVPGTCHVVIEGVTSEGRLIHEERDLTVRAE